MKLLLNFYALYQKIIFSQWYQKHLLSQERSQKNLLYSLLKFGGNTKFSKDHCLEEVKNYEQLKTKFSPLDYEYFKPYIRQIFQKEKHILFKGHPVLFAKTSGTMGDPKTIPITRNSFYNQVQLYRVPFLNHMREKRSKFMDHNLLFLNAQRSLQRINGFNLGTISDIASCKAPYLTRKYKLHTNKPLFCHSSVSKRIEKISVCIGMPQWFNEFLIRNNASSDYLEHFEVFFSSGMSYLPYLNSFKKFLHSKPFLIREFYAATEGFFAFQDGNDPSMLLICDDIFYEFIALDDYRKGQMDRRTMLSGIKTNIPYVILISTKYGFWSYLIGDVVLFTQSKPYRLQLLGRLNEYFSIHSEFFFQRNFDNVVIAINASHSFFYQYFVSIGIQFGSPPYYDWYIVKTSRQTITENQLALLIDKALKLESSLYSNSRLQNSLGCPKVTFIEEKNYRAHVFPKNCDQQQKIHHFENARRIANLLN